MNVQLRRDFYFAILSESAARDAIQPLSTAPPATKSMEAQH
ncbi:hypothetical protein [Desulfosarcina alkanivorans]|nr:hypothetical protein [Desulfosarcina alkanivorans]